MPKAIEWTAAQDHTIRRMRAESASWDRIAEAVGVTRQTAIARGSDIGAMRPPVECAEPVDMDRPCLPPGHPQTWGLLTAGTVLDGAAYSRRVFL